jgi:alcohol dehydrogenase (cytochrome c)
VRASYPNFSAALTTGGGLVFTGLGDGTFIAYDDTSLEPLWKIHVGAGINAPPMTFEAQGKQYVTVMTGLSRASKGRITLTPELRDMRDQTMLFVFGL